MTARDELALGIKAAWDEWNARGWWQEEGPAHTTWHYAADAVIAEGWVKMPSREAIMRVLRRNRTRGNTSADGDSGATADLILALLAGETS